MEPTPPPLNLSIKLRNASSYSELHEARVRSIESEDCLVHDCEKASFASHQGLRQYQEDRFSHLIVGEMECFMVADGHGGSKMAEFAATYLLHEISQNFNVGETFGNDKIIENAFITVHRSLRDAAAGSGACAVVCIKHAKSITIAWVGDCRALLVLHNGKNKILTTDHIPSSPAEMERVQNAGLFVLNGRVCGSLAVSRSLGDFDFCGNADDEKLQAVSCVPEIIHFDITEEMHSVVLISDGISESLCADEITHFVLGERFGPLSDACSKVVKHALNEGSTDNATIGIIKF